MNIDPFLLWLESTAVSQWVVGSDSIFAFPGILCLHAIGMGFAVGISVALDLRILGVAPGVPLAEIRRFVPIFWIGFWINAVSGVLLLIGYPTKALTNPVFYLKLALIAAGMVLLVRIGRRVFIDDASPHATVGPAEAGLYGAMVGPAEAGHYGMDPASSPALRRMAIASLICWTGAITAGRLLAYTYTRLTQLH
jgi:hypothetical protein